MKAAIIGFPAIPGLALLVGLAAPSGAGSDSGARLRPGVPRVESWATPGRERVAGYREIVPASPNGVRATTAAPETTFFGGTVWDPVDQRWEAIPGGTWTFDSGVGSHFVHSGPNAPPGIDPFKDTSLHAQMEGWIGIDLTYAGDTGDARRLRDTDAGWEGPTCEVGQGVDVTWGNWSWWFGLLPEEARALCYVGGKGYGNSWNICVGQSFDAVAAGASLTYSYQNDTEPNYDFSFVRIDTSGNGTADDVDIRVFDGVGSGNGVVESLSAGSNWPTGASPATPKPIVIKFCFEADGVYSDEDGLDPSDCGAFSFDNVSLTGVDATGKTPFPHTFETGADGWEKLPATAGPGGDWTNIQHEADIPPDLDDLCQEATCGLQDSVLVFYDPGIGGEGGHPLGQLNIAASPWIDLEAAGVTGLSGLVVRYNGRGNFTFYDKGLLVSNVIQYYPWTCPVTGQTGLSPWLGNLFVTFGGETVCTSEGAPVFTDLSEILDPNATVFRVGIRLLSACDSNCLGPEGNHPWIDNVRVGVYDASAPDPSLTLGYFSMEDAFPTDGSLNIDAPGRIDLSACSSCNEPYGSLGDTLTVRGGDGGAEVRVVFAVDPGPGIDTGRLGSWLSKHPVEGDWLGLIWRSARMDTAEWGGTILSGTRTWMTAYHEEDPNFAGTDTELDPDDLDPLGQASRLLNDIFPDDLLTPGSRLLLYYKSRLLTGNTWYLAPDTTGGDHLEMEVMPSSMAADSTFNCILYVDAADGFGAQPVIEAGLAALLPGGSANWENTAWDRWDTRSNLRGLGRVPLTTHGATANQLLSYDTIIWNTESLDRAGGLRQADVDALSLWLTADPSRAKGFYLSGDGVSGSNFSEPVLPLLAEYMGASRMCLTLNRGVRERGCPTGSDADPGICLPLAPDPFAHFPSSQALSHWGGSPGIQDAPDCLQGGPDLFGLSNSLLAGTAEGNLLYNSPVKGLLEYASISVDAPTYRSVLDGGSVHSLRDPGCNTSSAVASRLGDVLGWFGTTGGTCARTVVGVPGEPEPPAVASLRLLSPHPLSRAGRARFAVSLPAKSLVTLQVFDLAGRLVETVHRGSLPAGKHELGWALTDRRGRPVAAGLYFARMSGVEAEERIVKMMVLP